VQAGTHPRNKDDANADDDWHNSRCNTGTVDMHWHYEGKEAGDEHHKAQLTIHLCNRKQSHPE